jgi:hypothetical protein
VTDLVTPARFLDKAKRRARKADREDRGSARAEIVVTEAEASLTSAPWRRLVLP